ncbi:fidgetin-like [Thalassophryne amazonica]|uniref:fidgetin-like n=1 Tax=Thalassophryne amazonica TaxID=390379 RepID=UPI001470DE5D|nr:fidgetin-like [Thalassophryne amazonica]XP_034022605.1 fidgetin-like [Thalassophryne amazonica]
MLSPVTPYSLLKMHWSPEHATPLSQWPEQHLDVTSTTSPPSAHKHDPYATAARRSYAPAGYPWASDDISALTASSLLKRYAEKYSGLELSYERPTSGAYSETGTFLKTEPEPWTLGQGMECYPGLEALTGTKVGSASVGIPATGSVTVVSNLASDAGYSGAGSCTTPSSQEYPPAYNSTYLSSAYCPQPSAALPPAPLHSLQAGPTLVPSYSPSTPVYNYPPGCYTHTQTSLSSGYSHPSASYLPSAISAPTPLAPRPTMVGSSYSYSSHSLGASSESAVPLKRKAFEMAEEGQEGAEVEGSRYRKYGNGHGNSHSKGNGHGNGYDMSSSASEPQAYKHGKPLMSPPYGGEEEYSPPSGLAGESVPAEHNFPQQQRMSMKIPATHTRSEDSTGGR